MASSTTFVIVGGGLAGAKAVEALRRSDFGGRIILFGDEEHPALRPAAAFQGVSGRQKVAERLHHPDLRLVPRP